MESFELDFRSLSIRGQWLTEGSRREIWNEILALKIWLTLGNQELPDSKSLGMTVVGVDRAKTSGGSRICTINCSLLGLNLRSKSRVGVAAESAQLAGPTSLL